METVVLDPAPVEVTQLIEQRARLDLDRYDEVWRGPRGDHSRARDRRQLAVGN